MLYVAGIFANIYPQQWPSYVGKYSSTMEHMSGGQNYLFPAAAMGKTGSPPIGCEDFRSLITSSRKCCSLNYYK